MKKIALIAVAFTAFTALSGTAMAQSALPSSSPAQIPSAAGLAPSDLTAQNTGYVTHFLGSKPLVENRIDLRTQLDVSVLGKNNAENTIVRGPGRPTSGNNIIIGTQTGFQTGFGNKGINQTQATTVATGEVPAAAKGLFVNDIFAVTQIAGQAGAGNDIKNKFIANQSFK